MKTSISILVFFLNLFINGIQAQKNSGIFYSTLYAKEGVYLRGTEIGDKADYVFFNDINGDGYDDAVAVHLSGNEPGAIKAALSDGTRFTDVKTVGTIHAPYYWFPLMGDVNGDRKEDILYFNPNTNRVWIMLASEHGFNTSFIDDINGNITSKKITFLKDLNSDGNSDLIFGVVNTNDDVEWYSALSTGNAFGDPDFLGKTSNSPVFLAGEVTGDKNPELVYYDSQEKNWSAKTFSSGKLKDLKSFFVQEVVWKANPEVFLYDVDRDGKDDMVSWDREGRNDWIVYYSTGAKFEKGETWIRDHHAASMKNNVTPSEFGFIGRINGENSIAMVVSLGKWTGVEFTEKGKTESPTIIDTYESWGADYIPEGGTYDSGDPVFHDKQLKMIHDAGFTYITLDITNGYNDWVDNRAIALVERMKIWNENLQAGQHKVYFNISLGRTREIDNLDDFMTKLNLECKRVWDEFYTPYKELYYFLDGKPMVIHMINTGWDFIDKIDKWKGDKSYIEKITNRWMDGTQPGTKGKPNTYGWIVPGIYGNEIHPEMMPVMPGFWNGSTLHKREGGEQYRTQWLKVLENNPASVWVNSFNETWEHTSVEPSRLMLDQFSAHPGICEPWTDYYGNHYDYYYWDMTVQYNMLFMNNVLFEGAFLEEKNDPEKTIYRVTTTGFVKQYAIPVMAPVLLLPDSFRKNFSGKILSPL